MEYYKNKSLENLTCVFEGVEYEETWKEIFGYEGLYHVSSFGRVKRLQRLWGSVTGDRIRHEEIVTQTQNKWGYLYVELSDFYKNRKKIFVHVLVARAFIEKPGNNYEVNHKNGVKWDNRVTELEWNTKSENHKHAYRVLGKAPNKTSLGKKYELSCHSIPINQLSKEGVFIRRWSSQKEAADKLGLSQGNIGSAINGKYKSTGGFKWEYAKK